MELLLTQHVKLLLLLSSHVESKGIEDVLERLPNKSVCTGAVEGKKSALVLIEDRFFLLRIPQRCLVGLFID